MAVREIYITYEGHGVKITKKTPKDTMPIIVYESENSAVIPPHIGDLWLSFSKIVIIDKRPGIM